MTAKTGVPVARGDGGRGVVLRRVDVARSPAHVGAEGLEGLDEHGGLDGHVERAGDAGTCEWLGLAELLAQRHQARHFGLGDVEFLAAVIGQRDVPDVIVLGHGDAPRAAGTPRSAAHLAGGARLDKNGGPV